jgi:outer membrane assembly lipoprotein YfgL
LALVSSSGVVLVLNAETGAEIWRTALNSPVTAGVGFDGNRVAVITQSNELNVLTEGKVIWKSKLPALSYTAPFVAGGRVFVVTADRNVMAFDGASGQKLWTQQRTGEPLVLKQAGILTSYQDNLLVGLAGRLVALNPANGISKWETNIGTSRGTNEVERLVDLVAGISRINNVVCARSFQTAVTCLDANKGSNVWTRSSAGHVGLAGSEASVFGVESDSKLTAWSRDSGQVQWQSDALRFRGLTAPAAAEGQLLVGDDLGWIHWLDLRSGQAVARVQADATGIAMAPLRAGKNWVVVSKNGLVQAFRAE